MVPNLSAEDNEIKQTFTEQIYCNDNHNYRPTLGAKQVKTPYMPIK